jgi:hypothetical protein
MAVIDANWSVANVSTVWHERHSRVQAAACQGHNRQAICEYQRMRIAGQHTERAPPGLRGAYWPLERPVQLAQALGGPFSARSIRPKYSLALAVLRLV